MLTVPIGIGVIYSDNSHLRSCDFHGRSYLFREELESSQGSRGISWRLFLSSRVRWGAGRKRGTWASRRLGQARTILRVLLRKGDVIGREEKYRSWKLAPFKNCIKCVTLTHKGGRRSLNLLTAQYNLVGHKQEQWSVNPYFKLY